MFTIDRLAKLDSIATAVFGALSSGFDWLDHKYEDFLVNTTYRVVEAKERAISKAEYKVYDLEDEQAKTEADMHAKIADAALALDAADKDYEATVKAAFAKLGVEIIE